MNLNIPLLFCAILLSASLSAQVSDSAGTGVRHHHLPHHFHRTSWKKADVRMNGWNDVTIGAGYMSGRQFLYNVGADKGPEVTTALPACFLSYRYFFSKRIALGLAVGTQTLRGNSNYDNTGQQYTFRDVSTTFAAELTSVYFKRDNTIFYGRYGIGASYIEINYYGAYSSEYKTLPNVQFTPIGIRFGKAFAGFAELGIGYKGVVNAGLSYYFGSGKTWVGKQKHQDGK